MIKPIEIKPGLADKVAAKLRTTGWTVYCNPWPEELRFYYINLTIAKKRTKQGEKQMAMLSDGTNGNILMITKGNGVAEYKKYFAMLPNRVLKTEYPRVSVNHLNTSIAVHRQLG